MRAHHSRDRGRQLPPFRLFARKAAPAGRREPVILRLAVAIRHGLPPRADQALALQTMQCRIEGAVIHLEHLIRGSLDVRGDRVAMRRTRLDRPKDEHVQRPLHQFEPFFG